MFTCFTISLSAHGGGIANADAPGAIGLAKRGRLGVRRPGSPGFDPGLRVGVMGTVRDAERLMPIE